MQRIELQPAYVIHARAYRDTSMLVDFFTPDYGRVAAVARGVRVRKSARRAMINPFLPLLVSMQGKSALKLLIHVEASAPGVKLEGDKLFSGLYINELLIRLLPEGDSTPALYSDYSRALITLQHTDAVEPVLRRFETSLLQVVGYGVSFSEDAVTGAPLEVEKSYTLDVNRGFIPVTDPRDSGIFSGEDLLAIGRDEYSDGQVCRAAKQINRILLKPLLGHKPLQARSLFVGISS